MAKYILEKISLLKSLSGWGMWLIFTAIFTNYLYPKMILEFGNLYGPVVVLCVSGIVLFSVVQLVVSGKITWMSQERLQGVRKTILSYVASLGKLPFVSVDMIERAELLISFIVITVTLDPMVATFYFRDEEAEEKLNWQDILLFTTSLLVSNIWWFSKSSFFVYVGKLIFA